MRNNLRSLLDIGAVARNGWLSIGSGYASELMARVAWDSLTVDLQHGVQDYASMISCLQGISSSGVTPMVRVPGNDFATIGKALDAGAWGIICPMVNTAAQARQLVDACRYPPHGSRSNGPNRAAGYSDAVTYQAFANDEILVFPMLETVEAIANMEAILDVEGVSGVYLGPTDLSLAHGLPPIFDRDEELILDIYRRVIEAARERRKTAGVHTLSGRYAAQMAQLGFRLVTIGSDAVFVGQGARNALADFESDMPRLQTRPSSAAPAPFRAADQY